MASSRFIVPGACLLVAAAGLRRARFSSSLATNSSRICNQNPSCREEGLVGNNNCCPTDDGMWLACCDGPAPSPDPRMCSANQGCVDVGLTGSNNCCPTDDGMMLGCCDGPVPTPAPTPAPSTPAPTFAPTPASEQCPEFKSLLWETDMSGTYLAQHDGVASSDECCSFCDEMVECEGFAYNAANRACYLKGNFIGTFWNGGAVTRLKSSLGAGCPGFDDELEGKDLVGTLTEQWAAPDPEVCCASCARKEGCQGFTFFDGRCYLKAAVGGVYDNSGRITRVKAGVLPSA